MNPTEISHNKMASIVSWLAGFVIGLFVLVLPLGYFFISYQHLTGELEAETVLIANNVTQEVISSNPELWQYGQTRMEEFLNYRLRQPEIETRRVINSKEEIIAMTAGSKATPPLVSRSFPLFDSGVAVGRLEIIRSLRPILGKTALFAMVTLQFGAVAYLIMRTLPIRAIRRMEEALLKANSELEQKVHDRTASLDEANKELQTEITARRLKETELRESQQYLSAIIQFYPDATMVIDDKGTIVAWNLAIEELTGVRAEEMLGKGNYEYAVPFYGERRPVLIDLALMPDDVVEEKYSYIVRRDNKLIGESYINNASGQKVYFHGTAAPLRNSKGEIIGAIESIRDITERKQMEDRLRALSLGVEQSPASIVITDREGNIEYVNPKFTQLTGYTSAEAVGQNPRILKSGLTGPEVHRQLWETILSGGEWHGEFCNKKKNGELYWEFASISPIVDTKGEISRFIAVKEDITDRKKLDVELRLKNMILTTQQECSIDGILVVDENATILSYNQRFLEMWSIPPELVSLGKDVALLDFVASQPIDTEGFLQRVRHLYSHIDQKSRDEIVLKDGRIFDRYSAPMNGSDSSYFGRVWYFRDITEQKKSERILAESEAFLSAVLDSIQDGITVLDLDLKIVRINKVLERDYYKGNMITGEKCHEVYFGSKEPCAGCPSLRSLQNREPATEIFSVHGTDNEVWLELFAYPLLAPDRSRVTGVIEVVRDITSRKLAEKALAASEDRFRSLVESTSDWIWEVDKNGRYTYSSPQLSSLLGYEPEEVLDKTPFDLMPHEEVERVAKIFSALVAKHDPINSLENTNIRKDGQTVVLETKGVPFFDDTGAFMGYRGIDRDITERKQAEVEIHRLNAELEAKVEERTEQLLEAQEELVRKEKLSILGQLSGSVGHELRNPLGVMNNAVYFLKMIHGNSDEKTKEYLDIIKHEIVNSQRIITDLLDFARTKTPQTGAISVIELLNRSIGNCVIPGSVNLQTEIPDSLPLLKVDPLQLEQVFQNLITNAVQAMQGSGELRISANSTLDDDFIEISISDTGDGISPENMKKLFQPLFTTKSKGIGLGLVVCRNLVEANGGRIWVESEAGKGTVFNVILPH